MTNCEERRNAEIKLGLVILGLNLFEFVSILFPTNKKYLTKNVNV